MRLVDTSVWACAAALAQMPRVPPARRILATLVDELETVVSDLGEHWDDDVEGRCDRAIDDLDDIISRARVMLRMTGRTSSAWGGEEYPFYFEELAIRK